MFAGTTTGALFGLVSASLGGKFDLGVQRVLDVLQAFPDLTLALLLAAALGPGLDTVIIAIAATKVPFGGRVIRAVALQIREMDYVTAARSIGASHIRIMGLHIAPQCVASFLVLATTHLGVAIVIEAALGFLGVGIAPPTPTWGNMLAMQSNTLIPSWWLVVYPGAAISLVVLAFSLFGDSPQGLLGPQASGPYISRWFVPIAAVGPGVFSQRYERGSILVTTNLPFDEWTEVFGSERLTGALLDRLTHHVHILEMNGESYRLKRSRENAAAQAPDELDNP